MTYGKASFLVDWDGHGGAFVYEPTNHGNPWNGAWTQNLGQPRGRRHAVGVGWLRRYRGGIVLLNPSPSRAQSFSLRGRYITAEGAVVTEATVPPTSGLILRITPH
jgi:hypothetical protein